MDVTIRGGGVFGLAIGWECLRRGAKVRLIEALAIGAGASGGIVGALAPHVPESWNAKKAFQLDALLMADGFWRGVEAAGGLSTGYARTGRLQAVALGGEAMAAARSQTAGTLWQGKAQWSVEPAQGGWEPVSASGLLIRDTLSARIHPRRACLALAAAFVAQGGDLVLGDGVDSGAVVWATGTAGLADLSAAFGQPVGSGEKGQALALAFDAAGLPQIQGDGVHIVPHDDGTVAVGSTSERQYQSATATDPLLDALHQRAMALVPVLADAKVVARWAGLRPRATTRAPLLGEWPGRTGHFIANGGFKIGFGIAPKVAEVMADLLLDGVDRVPAGFRVADALGHRTNRTGLG